MKTSNEEKLNSFWNLLTEGTLLDRIVSLFILFLPIAIIALAYPKFHYVKDYYINFHNRIGELSAYSSYFSQFFVAIWVLTNMQNIAVTYLSLFMELRSDEELFATSKHDINKLKYYGNRTNSPEMKQRVERAIEHLSKLKEGTEKIILTTRPTVYSAPQKFNSKTFTK